MNKLLLLPLLLISAIVFGQGNPFPNYQQFGSATTRTVMLGAVEGQKGVVIGRYADTLTANNNALGNYIKSRPGAFIVTDNPRDELWQRNYNATAWINRGSFNITTINFLTDSSVVFCFGNGVCDTINFTNNVFVTNNDNSITVFNDSTLIVCSTPVGGTPVCDTLIFNIDSINNYFFLNDSTVVACDSVEVICIGDSCYTQQLCDTIPIPRRFSLILQNGLQFIAPGVGVFGNPTEGGNPSQLQYDTYLHTDFFNLHVEGKPVLRPVMEVKQIQWNSISPSVASWQHLGPNIFDHPSAADKENPVKLYLNYTNPFWADTTGFMHDRIGYFLGTNMNGNFYSFSLDNSTAKQSGIFFHTQDLGNTDAVTIFGDQTPVRYNFGNTPFPTTTLLNQRIAVFKTDGTVQFNYYPNSRDDGDSPDGKGFYSDDSGNLKYGLIGGGGGSSLVALQNSLWVAKNGNDATGIRNRVDKPFLTIRAAETAASDGDVIIVWPGTYEETDTLWTKNVNYTFVGKGEVQLVTSLNTGILFYDHDAVRNSVIDAPGWTFTARGDQTAFRHSEGTIVKIIADQITSNTNPALNFYEGSSYVKANKIYTANSFAAVYYLEERADLDADSVVSGINGSAIYFEDCPYLNIYAGQILTSPTNGDYMLYGAASNPTDSIFITAELIRGGTEWPVYIVGDATQVFINAKKITANSDCIVVSGTDQMTVTAQEIESTISTDTDGILHAEAGGLLVIDAKLKRNPAATGYDLLSSQGGTLTLSGVSYDQTRVNITGATPGTIRRIDTLWYGSNMRFTNARLEPDSAQVASANNFELGKGNLHIVSGSTQINAIYTAGWQAGSPVWLQFSGAPLVKHATAGGAGTAQIKLAGSADFQAAADDILALEFDGTYWHEVARKLAASAAIVTADNGLIKSTATNIQLGSPTAPGAPLLHQTYIDAGSSFSLNVNGSVSGTNWVFSANNTGTGAGVYGTAVSGNAVAGAATSGVGGAFRATTGVGITATSTSSFAGMFTISPATTNTVADVISISRQTTGTAANGIGQSVNFNVQTSDGVVWGSNQLISKWTTATTASRVSQFIITGVNNAITADLFTLSGSGQTRLNKYGVNTFAGTPVYDIGVDANGNLVEFAVPGGGSGDLFARTDALNASGGALYFDADGENFELDNNAVFTVNTSTGFQVSFIPGFQSRIGVSTTFTEFYSPDGNNALRLTNTFNEWLVINSNIQLSTSESGETTDFILDQGTYSLSGASSNLSSSVIHNDANGALDISSTKTINLDSDNATGTTTTSAITYISSTLTTGTGVHLASTSLSSGSMLNIAIASTAAASNTQKGLNISLSGANANASQTTYGVTVSNTHTGTGSQNIGVQGTATGGASANYGVWGVSSGNVGYGVYGSADGVGGNSIGVAGQNTTGYGVVGITTSGTALATDTDTGLPLLLDANPNSTNSSHEMIRMFRTVNGTAANGIGASITAYLEPSDFGSAVFAAEIAISYTDAASATKTSKYDFIAVNGGSTTTLLTLAGSGQATLPQYGGSGFTGTATKWLAVTSDGVIIQEDPPTPGGGGAWNDITSPTGDQALTFAAGESSTWTDQNTTEDLFTVNSSTGTTNSMFSLNRTGTALAAGNNIMEIISSGANGTNAITATGLSISVTNTNGTSGTNKALVLTASGATTLNTALEVTAGFVSIGDTGPQTLLQVGNDGGVTSSFGTVGQMFFTNNGSPTYITGYGPASTEVLFGAESGVGMVGTYSSHTFAIRTNNTPRMSISNGGVVTIADLAGTGSRNVVADASGVLSAPVSDISVKKNIQLLNYGTEELMKLKPVSFEYVEGWKSYGNGTQLGFIAQDIQQVLPNSVFTTPTTGKMGYNSTDLIPLLTKALQESIIRIENLENEIKLLKNK